MELDANTRSTPFVRHIILWTAFVLLLVAGVATVVVPELSDDRPEDEGASEEAHGADP